MMRRIRLPLYLQRVSSRFRGRGFCPLYPISKSRVFRWEGNLQWSTFCRTKAYHLRSCTPRSAKVVEVEYFRNPASAILIAFWKSSLDKSATWPSTSAEEG